jgi:TonB family protein
LLVELEPRHRVFLRNLADLLWFRRPAPLKVSSRPGRFWPDVFVASGLPWRRFLESFLYHGLTLAAVWGASQLWLRYPHRVQARAFDTSNVVVYSASDYLPPLDTGTNAAPLPQQGEPEYARQPIISVPPEPDNRTQTIVTPPDIKLTQDVAVPNIVAWSHPDIPVPIAATSRPIAQIASPALPTSVVAPPPELTQAVENHRLTLAPAVIAPPPEVAAGPAGRSVQAIEPAIIAPPPGVELASIRKVTDINIGHTQVVAPAPQLPMAEQRSLGPMAQASSEMASPQVVPPPPAAEGVATGNAEGRLIALGIHPSEPTGPVEPPAGNRRGTFAATPEGKPDAPGTPNITADNRHADAAAGHSNGNGGGSGEPKNGVPSGLLVGAGPKDTATSAVTGGLASDPTPLAGSVSPRLLASAVPPRVSSTPPHGASPVPEMQATEVDKQVFGDRRFYSLTLNMPNLNSAGGSWIVRFAELKDDGQPGELIAPEATRKVDPAYPIELMRRNVQGTVTLHAVIRSDGSVGDVRVLRSVDDNLDEYARAALSRWHFRPALKNGNAVDLEAVVMIPFRPQRKPF